MADIAVIDIVVPPPTVIEVVTGTKGDPGPPGPPGIPGPHAATHGAAGADAVDVTALAGYPGGSTTFLRADHTFALAGAALPTAPVGQVLSSQGDGIAPAFRPSVLVINPTGPPDQRRWELKSSGTDFVIEYQTDDGASSGRRVYISAFNGSMTLSPGASFEASNSGGVNAGFLRLISATVLGHVIHRNLGTLVNIEDSTTQVPGAVITGGGLFNVLARWNGSDWIVIGG